MTDALYNTARTAMLNHGMQPDFSSAAQAQTQALQTQKIQPDQRDLRAWLWCSIDNDDSRDLDQLSVAQAQSEHTTRLWVAIAHVPTLVPLGSPIDEHARANTTSIYTAAGVFPMLPPKLSTDLTSLNPGQDRLSLVIEMDIDTQGQLTHTDVYSAWVRNHAQLSYHGVATWLQGQNSAPPALTAVPGLDKQLQCQYQVALALRAAQARQGALGLQTREARPVFTDGVLTDMQVDPSNCAQEMIASFMIAANGVVAQFLDRQGVASIRRVLPPPARWDRIVHIAHHKGQTLPAQPDAKALHDFLSQQKSQHPEEFSELSLSIVKLLGSGQYMLAKPGQSRMGHFGLAVNDYAHATAPNRRYVDFITHHLLASTFKGQPSPLDDVTLTKLAQHCTEQQKQAKKVERQVRKSAAAVLMAQRLGHHFDAIVTGASAKGVWVRTIQPMVEGRLVEGGQGLDIGDRIQVQLSLVDAKQGFIDFTIQR